MPLRVDVVSGATTLYEEDLCLPGFIPLTLARVYRSDRTRVGPFGPGWHFNLDLTLERAHDRLVFRGALCREVVFAPVQVGVQATHHETGLVLQHHPDAYILFFSPLLQQVFLKRGASGNVLRVARIEDRSGNTLRFGYSGGRLIQVIDTVGRQVQFTYSGDQIAGIRLVAAQEGGQVRIFRYRGRDLVAVQDAMGREARYTYQDHLMVTYTNRLGGLQHAHYDEQRRCTALWRGDGSLVRRFAYDAARQETLVQATDGLQTVYRHAEGTQVFARLGPSGRAQHYYYDAYRRLAGFTDEDENVVTMQRFDPEERTFVLITGSERAVVLRLDEHGLARQATVGVFGPFDLIYDDRGHLGALAVPSGGRWTFERDRHGAVVQVVSPEGRSARLVRSSNGRDLAVSDEQGPRFTEQYDAFGRLVERTDALGRRQRRHYDAEGRLSAVDRGGSYRVQFTYDAAGHLVGVSNTEGFKASFRRDAFGRLLAQTGADAETWQFQYDREGRPVAASRPGRSIRFEYDLDRLVRSTASEGSGEPTPELACEYGLAGELRAADLADGPVHFAYDADGRLEAIARNTQQLAFFYDGDGLPIRMEHEGRPPVSLRRDRRGRLVEMQTAPQGIFRLSYDAADRLTTLQQAAGMQVQVQFQYDVLDRLVEARVAETSGQPARTHRFFPGSTEVVSLVLEPSPAGTDERSAGAPRVTLLLSRHGQVFVLSFERLQVPVWGQDAALHREAAAWTTRMAACCVHGVEAVLHERAQPDPHVMLQQWKGGEDLRWLYNEVPAACDVGWAAPLLDAFFLRRTFFDRFYPGWGPLYVPHPRADWPRSPDGVASGPHVTGSLKPSFSTPVRASAAVAGQGLAFLINSLT